MGNAVVAGVGMTQFQRPSAGASYIELGEQAARQALADAGLEFKDVQQVISSNVYAGTSAGQAVLHALGATGVPVINVTNACASGTSAIFLARQLVESGALDCVLAIGFEQMPPGPLRDVGLPGLPDPMQRFTDRIDEIADEEGPNLAMRCFGAAGSEMQKRFGVEDDTFASVVVKARRHGADNPLAIFRDQLTIDDVLASPRLSGAVTRLQACAPTTGAAATVLVSERFAAQHGVNASVIIRAQSLLSDVEDVTKATSPMTLLGDSIIRRAAKEVYEKAGIGPEDLDAAEIHDCFAVNELVVYSSLGLTSLDNVNGFVRDQRNTYGGDIVINPSGGLLSKGHPLGATGLAQCAELVWQLRGLGGSRQVEGARLAVAENSGIGSTGAVTLYERVH